MSIIRTKLLAIVVAVGALAGGFAPAAAHATTLLTCTGTESVVFTPALTNTTQNVTLHLGSSYGPCVNATNPLELRTGTVSTTIPLVPRSCSDLLSGPSTTTRVIHWSTGTTSTWTFTITTEEVAAGVYVSTRTGTITAGQFQGATAIGAAAHASGALLACSTTGLTNDGGVASLTILQ